MDSPTRRRNQLPEGNALLTAAQRNCSGMLAPVDKIDNPTGCRNHTESILAHHRLAQLINNEKEDC